jgi:predicted PurR-regulated permease PerM
MKKETDFDVLIFYGWFIGMLGMILGVLLSEVLK